MEDAVAVQYFFFFPLKLKKFQKPAHVWIEEISWKLD